MKTAKKISFFLLGFIIVFTVVFYFWGSASKHDVNEYDEVIVVKSENLSAHNDTLSLLTYNLGYLSGMTNNQPVERTKELFAGNLEKAIKLISGFNPDFIGFQEIDFKAKRSYDVNQLKEIASADGYNYAAMAVNWDKNYVPFPYGWPNVHFGQIYSGQAILSKFPILSNTLKVLRKPESHPFYYSAFYLDRIAQIDKVDINGKEVVLINVHLEAFDVTTREKQAETLIKIYRQYAKDYPVLLFGDFNSTPPNATQPYAVEETMKIIFSEPGIKAAILDSMYYAYESKYFTFDSRNPEMRIDYIFYNSNKIKAIEARVIKEAGEISDHIPVYMRFVLK